METVVSFPSLTSIEEGAQNAGLADAQFGLLSEPGVVPHTLVQLGHDCGCLGNPTIDLHVDGQRAGDSGPEVSEVLNDFQSESVNGNVWRGICSLRRDVGLLSISSSKLLEGMGEAVDKLLQSIYYV